jgi:hypothetical protein
VARAQYSGHLVVKLAHQHGWRRTVDEAWGHWSHPEHGVVVEARFAYGPWLHTRADGTRGKVYDRLIDVVLELASVRLTPNRTEEPNG